MSDVSLVMSPVTACITTFPSLVSCCPELETTLEKHPLCCTEKKKASHKNLVVNSAVKQTELLPNGLSHFFTNIFSKHK